MRTSSLRLGTSSELSRLQMPPKCSRRLSFGNPCGRSARAAQSLSGGHCKGLVSFICCTLHEGTVLPSAGSTALFSSNLLQQSFGMTATQSVHFSQSKSFRHYMSRKSVSQGGLHKPHATFTSSCRPDRPSRRVLRKTDLFSCCTSPHHPQQHGLCVRLQTSDARQHCVASRSPDCMLPGFCMDLQLRA